MLVNISYRDTESLTVEEIVAFAQQNYGKSVKIEIKPESNMAYDHIYFGLQQLITQEQLSLYYAKGGTYEGDIKRLRSDVLYKVQELIDQVIIDNESKVA